jgi:predicted dienelactone hydrolase
MGLEDPVYLNPKIYYPKNATPPFASVSLSLGFTESRDQLEWWGPVLASHGIVSFHCDPNSAFLDFPPDRAMDLKAQIAKLKAENARSGSPLQGKLDLTRLGLMGHSMGGGATLIASNDLTTQIRAAVPLQPWEPGSTFPKVTAATLILAGETDGVADNASNSIPFYKALTSNKAYAEVKGGDHMIGTGGALGGSAEVHTLQARLALAWLKIYLEDDMRYVEYVTGAQRAEIMSQLSDFQSAVK